MKNILKKEPFGGEDVLNVVADWLLQRDESMKWILLAKMDVPKEKREIFFYLPDVRPLPQSVDNNEIFLKHGWIRNPIVLRGYSRSFSPNAAPCQFLRMRAMFGVNAQSDVLRILS